MKTGIYKIVSPDGHIYIGQSIDIEKRFAQHRRNPSRSHGKLKSSFKYYGPYNHEFEIIEECNFDDLNARETHWINYYTNRGYHILNSSSAPTGKTKRGSRTKWVPINGCSNYLIGSNGQVKRLKHRAIGDKHRILEEMIMENHINRTSVVYVSIKDDFGNRKVFSVQKLVVDTFLEKGRTYYKTAPDWEQVNHRQVFNNRVDQFVPKELYDRMTYKPTIYKTIKT